MIDENTLSWMWQQVVSAHVWLGQFTGSPWDIYAAVAFAACCTLVLYWIGLEAAAWWDRRRPIVLTEEDKKKLDYVKARVEKCLINDLRPRKIGGLDLQIEKAHCAELRHLDAAHNRDFIIALGLPVLRGLTQKQCAAVVLHECGHIAQSLDRLRLTRHEAEYGADEFAAAYMGARTCINALRRVGEMIKRNCGCIACVTGVSDLVPSPTHPSREDRIQNLYRWRDVQQQLKLAEAAEAGDDEALLRQLEAEGV